MRILKLALAAALALGTLGALTVPAAPAEAQRHSRGDGHHWRGDGHRHWRGDGHRHWRGHRRVARGHYRNRRVCRNVWRHGHRHRVCRMVRVRWR